MSKLFAKIKSICLKSENINNNNPIIFSIRFVLLALLSSLMFLGILLTAKLFIGLTQGLLVLITFLIELFVMIKTISISVYKRSHEDEGFEGDAIQGVTKKLNLISYLKTVIRDQLIFLLPFFLIFEILINANYIFFAHSIVSFVILTIMISSWALLIFGAVCILKKSCKNLSKKQEISLTIVLLFVSIVLLFIFKDISISYFNSASLVQAFNQVVTTIQSLVLGLNSNFWFCINILSLILVMQGFVCLLALITVKTVESIEKKNTEQSITFEEINNKYYNNILKSCLARSPTQ